MRIGRLLIASLAFVAFTTTTAHAGVRVGIGIGIGVPCYPCYRPYYYGYPYPYYVPGVVVVGAPAPVVVGLPAPVVVGSSQPPAVPAIAPTSAPPRACPAARSRRQHDDAAESDARVARARPSIASDLGSLTDPDAKIRGKACINLGRLKDNRAVRPLCPHTLGR